MHLKTYLKINRINVKDFAKKVNVSWPMIYAYCRGKYKPSFSIAIRIQQATDGLVSIGDLMDEYITIEEAAIKYHQSESSVRTQIQKGLIRSFRMEKNGVKVIHVSASDLAIFHENKWIRQEGFSEEEVSVTQASKLLGLSDTRIYNFVRDGLLPAEKRNSRWILKRKDVNDFMDKYLSPIENPLSNEEMEKVIL